MNPLCMSSLIALLPGLAGAAPLPLGIVGDFTVKVGPGTVEVDGKPVTLAQPATLGLDPAVLIEVHDERYDTLPVFNPQGAPWAKGAALRGVATQETTAAGLLVPDSVVVKAAPGNTPPLAVDRDYGLDPAWGTFGRLEGGAIADGQAVYVDYRYGLSRLDSVVLDGAGHARILRGTPHVCVPRPPEVPPGQLRVANIWLPGRLERLTEANLFPIEATSYPEPAPEKPSVAERLVPKAMAKLRSGEKVTILAWGDSVTVGTFVPDWQTQRWQEQFVARLRERYPQANIELVTVAWGGRNVQSFLAEPPGSEYNYQEQILDRHPDLIVSEFVNDAYLDPAGVEDQYGKLLADFQGIGAEWIILTPHYVRPDWMGLTSERDCDADPRPYVRGLREFAPRHNVALADASLRWGHLWREGIPYTTLLLNAINHPDERGMKLFADALMALFPAAQ